MLEKSGTITLTDGDLKDLQNLKVSDRVKSNWNLSLAELQKIVATNSYVPVSSGKPV